MRRCFVLIAILVAATTMSLRIQAHPTLDSQIALDMHDQGVSASIKVPLPDFLLASQIQIGTATGGLTNTETQALKKYLGSYLRFGTEESLNWPIENLSAVVLPAGVINEPALLHVQVFFRAPQVPIGNFLLRANFITHEVRNHQILVLTRSDWRTGFVAGPPILMGALGHEKTQILITRGRFEPYRAFLSFAQHGAMHILTGYDHLLFLALVLIAACFQSVRGHWADLKDSRQIWISTLRVITAFTVGHSLTLALGALGLVSASTVWVEILVAASVISSAIHLLIPLYPNREVFIASGFGLIHGLAFAQTLDLLNLALNNRITALFAFNLGIELVQIILAALALPLALYGFRTYPMLPIRQTLGTLASFVGVVWLVQRAFTSAS